MLRLSTSTSEDSLKSTSAEIQTLRVGTLTTTGAVVIPNITISGNASISGAVSAGSVSTSGSVTAGSVSTSGTLTAQNVSVPGDLNVLNNTTMQGTLVTTGLLTAIQSGVRLTTGAPALSVYNEAANSITPQTDLGVNLAGTANLTYIRIGRVVTIVLSYNAPGSINIGGRTIALNNVIPIGFRHGSGANLVFPAIAYVPDTPNESQPIAFEVLSDGTIRMGRTGFSGNPLSGFSQNGPFNLYGATISYIV